MFMSEDEIRRSYREAKDPEKQIKILADMNCCTVQDIAEDDCLLFMWATFPNLDVALEAIKRWGFTYKTAAFVWVKRNKKSPSWFWGLGNWTRANAEVCLLATKGKLKRASASVHSVIDAPIGRHSEKPAETRDRIVRLAGGYTNRVIRQTDGPWVGRLGRRSGRRCRE